MPAVYDESILQQFADDLYSRASAMVLKYVLLWTFLGLGLGLVVASSMRLQGEQTLFLTAIVTAVLAVAGGFLGSSRAFNLRLEAQRTLCQMQVERNTRT